MNTALHPAPRPRLGFRVGVTGARPNRLDPAAVPALASAVDAVLRRVRATIEALAAEPETTLLYAPAPPIFRFISPLAEGADRIAAEAALALGFHLEVPMPFSEPEYKKTFAPDSPLPDSPPGDSPPPDSPSRFPAFEPLLARALTETGKPATLALDGSREEDAAAAYRAVGRLVVRNSDLLIAIWDGTDGKPGGTAEIVRYAAHAHVPIWWIDAQAARPPRLLVGPAIFERRETAPADAAAEAELALLLRAATRPPDPGEPLRHGWLGEIMHRFALLFGDRREPLPAFFAETEEPRRPWPWTTHRWLLQSLAPSVPEMEDAPRQDAPPHPSAETDDEAEGVWQRIYVAADRQGAKYADRYRSSYVLVIILAALTVATLGVGLALPHPAAQGRGLAWLASLTLTACEFAALVAIAAIVAACELGRWHEKWIAYRLLAELCRKVRVLAPLAWSLPLARLTALPDDRQSGAAARNAWVAWYITATMRSAPLPRGSIGRAVPSARALGAAMLAEQMTYHRHRRDQSATALHRLALLADLAFGITVLLVAAKLFLTAAQGGPGVSIEWLSMLSVALVALSAASVSLRSYAEFGLLHLQSERMLRALAETKAEFDALDPDRPLASAAFGAVLYGLALAMLEDVEGWSLLFRTKTPETG